MGSYHPIDPVAAEPAPSTSIEHRRAPLLPGGEAGANGADGTALLPIPVPVHPRSDGWTVERQRGFLEALAETGSVSEAARSVGMSANSAYRLRARADADAFDIGWKAALRLASSHLTAVAWDRAVNGVERPRWHKGEIVGTERVPSDRLLMFLLQAHDPWGYKSALTYNADPRARARETFAEQAAALVDPDAPPPAARRERASRA